MVKGLNLDYFLPKIKIKHSITSHFFHLFFIADISIAVIYVLNTKDNWEKKAKVINLKKANVTISAINISCLIGPNFWRQFRPKFKT